MTVNGKITQCMEKEYINGMMEENIKANIKMIRNMGKVYFIGQMEVNSKETGKMENKMELGFIFRME